MSEPGQTNEPEHTVLSVLRGAEEICRARVTVACVNSATHRPCMIPRRLREALAAALPQRPDTRQQSMEIPA